jgi:hypothetical protein
MPSNHLFTEYSALGTYKLIATNFFDYLILIEWIKIHQTLFYSISEDKQKLTIHIKISSWLFDDFKNLLPDNIILEKD